MWGSLLFFKSSDLIIKKRKKKKISFIYETHRGKQFSECPGGIALWVTAQPWSQTAWVWRMVSPRGGSATRATSLTPLWLIQQILKHLWQWSLCYFWGRQTINIQRQWSVWKKGTNARGKPAGWGSRHAQDGEGLPSTNTVARLDLAEGCIALKEVGKQSKGIPRHRGFKVLSVKRFLVKKSKETMWLEQRECGGEW